MLYEITLLTHQLVPAAVRRKVEQVAEEADHLRTAFERHTSRERRSALQSGSAYSAARGTCTCCTNIPRVAHSSVAYEHGWVHVHAGNIWRSKSVLSCWRGALAPPTGSPR
jgi:hypothetical protein